MASDIARTAWVPILGFSLAVIAICSPLGILLFVRRRHLQPLAARPPTITIASQILLTVYTVHTLLQRIFAATWPCVLTLLFGYCLVVSIINLYLLRVWILWFAYRVTLDKTRLINPFSLNEEGGWYLRHRKYHSSTFLARMYFVVNGSEMLIFWSTFAYAPNIFQETSDICPAIDISGYIYVAIVLGNAIIFAYSAAKFGQVVDGFFIKDELKYLSIVTAIGTVIWFILNQFEASNRYFPTTTTVVTFLAVYGFYMSTIYPIRKSYEIQKLGQRSHLRRPSKSISRMSRMSTKSVDYVSELEFVLSSEEGRQAFKEHLVKEFSVENFLFWDEAERFEENFEDIKDKYERASQISEKYISDDAPLQVNIEFDNREIITKQLGSKKINQYMFKNAKSEILKLMAIDSFVRFDKEQFIEIVPVKSSRPGVEINFA